MFKKLLPFVLLGFLLAFPKPSFAATLSLSPSSLNATSGNNYSVNVNLDTAGAKTIGTDIILSYDPSKLDISDISNGALYPGYIGKSIDTVSGRVSLSGLAGSNGLSTSGVFATLNFKVKDNASGNTDIKFDFDPNDSSNTTDTNVVESNTSKELLRAVTNSNINIINSASCPNGQISVVGSVVVCTTQGQQTQTGPTPSPSASPSPSVSPNPSPSPVASPSVSPSPSASPSANPSPSVSPSPSASASTVNVTCNDNQTKQINGSTIICISLNQNQNQNQDQTNNNNQINNNSGVTVLSQVSTDVTQLPKTGLPIAGFALGGLLPMGATLKKRFSKAILTSANAIWNERQFKS